MKNHNFAHKAIPTKKKQKRKKKLLERKMFKLKLEKWVSFKERDIRGIGHHINKDVLSNQF